ncbi:MAG TPA: RDD family protein [Candidatus Methylomirabilis sp.]|nr:RDD family protein [Candidatus Methylomirabilis sp.]
MRDLQPAGLWRRLAARLVDCVVGLLAWSLCAMWLVIGAWGFRRAPLELREVVLLALAVVALGAALHVVYHVAFIGGCGQTPGKMALGIAVVRRDGERAGHARAVVRCLAGMLSVLTLGLSSIGVFFTRDRRGFADWLAGTRVVRVRGEFE